MLKKNKILYIATNNLFRRSGGGLAILAYYEAVKNIYGKENVDLILPKEAVKDGSSEDNYFRAPRRNRIIAILCSIFGDLHRFRKYVFLHLKAHHDQYELCVINGGVYAGDMIDNIKSYGIKVVVIHHNYEKEYCKGNRTSSSFFGVFPYYIIRNERNAYYKADLNLFLTNSDMNLFDKYYGKCNGKKKVIGTFEPVPQSPPLIRSDRRQYTLIITGSLEDYQTKCGINDFYKNYYQIIYREYPDAKILLAGRNPAKSIIKIAKDEKDRISIIPNPQKMEEIIELGFIYYCPVNVGGGLKLRVMDGLRQGLPVLVHKVSSRGYDIFFDKPYFQIYNDLETFNKGLRVLLNLYRENMIDNKQIQNDYNNCFSFDAGCKRLEERLSLIG
jgi:hypothetical protein